MTPGEIVTVIVTAGVAIIALIGTIIKGVVSHALGEIKRLDDKLLAEIVRVDKKHDDERHRVSQVYTTAINANHATALSEIRAAEDRLHRAIVALGGKGGA